MPGRPPPTLFVNNVFSGLVRFDANLSVVPDLADGWEVDETGTVYTFTLRGGIIFHDGRPITADDFKYSCVGTIEERIDSILERKQALFDQLIDDVTLDLSAQLSREELFGLFGLEPTTERDD